MNSPAPSATALREVVVGCNSKVWRALQRNALLRDRVAAAISHREVDSFAFSPADRVWVFSYSRSPAENRHLLDALARAGVAEIAYVSSASTVVTRLTGCYEYPRVKRDAELETLRRPQGRVLTIGLVYEDGGELPGGDHLVTAIADIAVFMLSPIWSEGEGRKRHLVRRVSVPFRSGPERLLYEAYGILMSACGRHPCVLRPLDLALRTARMRWYGYVYLSNRLWTSMTS